MNGLRIVWVLVAVVASLASATSNPPPQAMPPRPQQAPGAQPYAAQPYGTAGAQQYGSGSTQPHATAGQQYTPCEYACGQVSRCNLAPYATCLAECRRTGTEQQPNGPQALDTIARSSCDQLAAYMRGSASTPVSAAPTDPYAQAPVASPPATPPPAAKSPAIGLAGSVLAGHWVAGDHVSYTNAAMTSADFFLDVTVESNGAFRGSWARYVCFAGAYGIMSCGKGQSEGSASGRFDGNGTGSIELQNLGRSSLSWRKSGNEVALELPRNWQGSNVLFRSTLKR